MSPDRHTSMGEEDQGKRDTLNGMQGREPVAGVVLRKIRRLVSPMVPVAAKVKAGERSRMAV